MARSKWMTLVAAIATLLTAAPLGAIFVSMSWVGYVVGAVLTTSLTAGLVRHIRGPVWTQVVAACGTLVWYLTIVFPSGGEIARVIPTGTTLRHLTELLSQAGGQIRSESVPVPDRPGLLLLSTVGIGVVAIVVDFFAVGLHRPALAGLPMLAVYSVPVAVLPERLSFVPFLFAATGYLWLLAAENIDRVRHFGRRYDGEGRDIAGWESSPLSAAGRRLGLIGIVVALLLPLGVPGMTSGLIDTFGTGDLPGGRGGGRGGTSVDLFARLSGELNRDRVIDMVRISTDDPTPYYLRLAVADKVSVSGFTSDPPSSGIRLDQDIPGTVPTQANGVTIKPYHATITAIDLDMGFAPAYQHVTRAQGLDDNWLFDPLSDELFSRRSRATGSTYDIDFADVSFTPAALRKADASTEPSALGRSLIEVPPIAEVSDLVHRLTKGKSTEYDRVRAIYDHFSPENGFSYRVRADHGTSTTAIVSFLDKKAGYCVQYAAAMAWLVRAAGYPARVAFGFTRGALSGNAPTVLTNFNLHAWTEVYFPSLGWVPFDPTPPSSVTGSVSTAWAPDPAAPDPGGEPEEVDRPNSATPAPQRSADDRTDELEAAGAAGDGGASGGTSPWWFAGVAIALGLIALLLAPALQRTALRRRRLIRGARHSVRHGRTSTESASHPARHGDVRDPNPADDRRIAAHLAWAELLDTLVDYDVAADPALTPRATAAWINALDGLPSSAGEQVDLLARAEEFACYARSPLEAGPLAPAVRRLRDHLRQRATRRQRITAALLPGSTLNRWRDTRGRWADRTARAGLRWRAAMRAANPLRLLARRG